LSTIFVSADRAFVALNDATAKEVVDHQNSGRLTLILYANILLSTIGLVCPLGADYDLREFVNGFQLLDIQRHGPFYEELSRWNRWAANRVGRGSLVLMEFGDPITIDILDFAQTIDRTWLR
jgi:hypothetical protein